MKWLRTLCASVQELRAIFEEVSWDVEELLDLVGHDCGCDFGNEGGYQTGCVMLLRNMNFFVD